MREIGINVAWLKERPRLRIRLEGHADESGTDAYNFRLGKKRALAVMQVLMDGGIDSSRLDVVSHGEEIPAMNAHGDDAMALNRRVEFVPMQGAQDE